MKDLSHRLAHLSLAKQALVIQQLQSKLEALERLKAEPIAIIGMGCRFPGDAHDPSTFWALLKEGRDAITEVSPDRWDWRDFCDSEPMTPGKANTRWGGFLSQVADFDAHAFGLSPREAARMDPQQRLLLEVTWEALENAGIAMERLHGSRTGVFIGYQASDYARLQFREPSQLDALVGTGNAGSMAASRLSYWLDLRGPSLAIDTACSSSLVAVHLACQSLHRGESTMALAGGVNLILLPETNIIFSRAGLIAPDGRCKVFDERADGYTRSEGAGLVVLKPLSQAVADADSIYAVIIGGAVNQDGRSNGITAPNRQAQEALLREAYRNAGLSAGEVQYIEAHGTGTALGDLIEVQALGAVLATDRSPEQPCRIGSVKSNVGHLETAAGIASLIKVALALKHKEIPPTLHFRRPNPRIPFDELPLRVVRELESWPAAATPAHAGVSSFSFGGMNAHLVFEEAPVVEPPGPSRPWQVLVLSAKTSSALESATTNLTRHLQQNPEICLADVAYTLQTGRSLFSHRRMVVCQSVAEAAAALETLDPKRVFTKAGEASDSQVVFMFPGLGDHYLNMAQGIYQDEPEFRVEVDRCCEMLKAELEVDLRSVIFAGEKTQAESQIRGLNLRKMLRRGILGSSADSDWMNQTSLVHPAVFIIEYALARLFMSWGLRPRAMIGHSLGEYVAACLAGVFSVEEGLRLVVRRAQLIQQLPRGAMLGVALSEEELEPYLVQGVSLAAVNGPRICVLAGPEAEIQEVERKLGAKEVAMSRLPVEHAFHSKMMREIEGPFRALLREIMLQPPQIPYVSNVTGKWIVEEEATSVDYWVKHLCQAVRFGEGIEELLSGVERVMIEVGPGQSLSSFVKLHPLCRAEQVPLVVSSMRARSEQESDERCLMKMVGKLWLAGVALDWNSFYKGERRYRVLLPTYPFQRQRHWFEPHSTAETLPSLPSVTTEPRVALADAFYLPVWKEVMRSHEFAEEVLAGAQTSWLILSDECGIGERLAARLRRANQAVVTVACGAVFRRNGADHYTINPGVSEDYHALIKAFPAPPEKVVHLWNLPLDDGAWGDLEGAGASQERGFYSLLWLVQALGDRYLSRTIELVVVSSQLHIVTGDERICPAKATLLGPCRVIPFEYPQLTCRSVDVWPLAPAGETEDQMVERLIVELSKPTAEPVVALRGAHRWVESFEPTRLSMPTAEQVKWRKRGVYLITGGLGGVGLALAEYLAANWEAKLILVGRSRLPERAEWPTLLAREGETDGLGRKLAKLQSLEAAGTEVLALSADVANLEQMEAVVRQARERFGVIHGVIHAAGTPGVGLMQLKSIDRAASVLSPKMRGTLVLERVLAGEELDLTVLCSSVTALIGGPGQVDYCGANAFLDAYAEWAHGRGRTTISINWGEWQWDAWQAGLAGFNPDIQEYFQANRQRYGISFEEGREALTQIVASGRRRLIVSMREFRRVVEECREYTAARMLERSQGGLPRLKALRPTGETKKAESSRSHAGRTENVYAPASNRIEKKVAAIFEDRLGLEQVRIDDNFFDLGGNSLIGLQIINDLRRDFDIQIPTIALFEAPTVGGLAKYLGARLGPHQPESSQPLVKQQVHSVGQREVAIIGMAGRFPGANSIDEFWRNLTNGVESLSFFSDGEIQAAGVDPELLTHPNYVKARPIITGCDLFDAGFFGYSPRDAELTDPQHRLFLECAWEAIENGGYQSGNYRGQIGVFAGANISSYWLNFQSCPDVARSVSVYQLAVGNDKDSLTTNVSYKLNLKGPSLAVQTHCSTSLVAVHLACQSLLLGECDMALAGGVSIRVPQKVGYLYDGEGMDSPDGRTRAFDARAQGTVIGDGVGVVLLKRLADALADGDSIYAVIKGSAINNDGSSKVGFTAPSVEGQSEAVAIALSRAQVDARTIGYIEAHGTATRLGDPIEVSALTKAFRASTDAKSFCAIGSVKSNVGHLDKAAGVTGLIKATLALKHGMIPPSLHFIEPNPEIDFENSPFYVNTRLSKWESNGHPRRAGVNSLGMGGTNAHVVLEEAPALEPSGDSRPWQLLVMSAKTGSALERMRENLIDYLRRHSEVNIADLAYTLQLGRRIFDHRLVAVCQSHDQAARALEELNREQVWSRIESEKKRPLVMMFPGLGEQYTNMAGGLYRTERVFRAEVDDCCEQLKPWLGVDLRRLLFRESQGVKRAAGLDLRLMLQRGKRSSGEGEDELNRTHLAQPAVFVIEYALAQLLRSWGLRPQAMIGHSLGEYVAACLAGVFSLADGLKLVAGRARLIEGLPGGGMLAVALGEEELGPYLGPGISLAAINGPRFCALAGTEEAMAEVERELRAKEVAVSRLLTRHAFHSELMREIEGPFQELLNGVRMEPPRIPYVSNVTGKWIEEQEATSVEYWVKHLCQAVRFEEGVRELLSGEECVMVEVGPGQNLSSFVKLHPWCGAERAGLVLSSMRSESEGESDEKYLMRLIGKLWLAGVEWDWGAFYEGERRRRVPLPTYPFERQRYWIEPHRTATALPGLPVVSAEPKATIADAFYLPTWSEDTRAFESVEDWLAGAQTSWLVLLDEHGIGEQIAARLRQFNQSVTTVARGAFFHQESADHFTMNPGASADYRALIKSLPALPDKILHLSNLSTDDGAWKTGEGLEASQERSFYSLLWLAQALGDHQQSRTVELVIVSSQVHLVTGEEAVCPAKALLLGPCRVIPFEYPQLTCRNVDFWPLMPDPEASEGLVDRLLTELSRPSAEPSVAYRGAKRWVESFKSTPLPRPAVSEAEWREGGVYLITGGLGGVGLALAEYLAVTWRARLVLVGRSELPERSAWAELLASEGETSELGRKLAKLQALEAAGGEVLALSADVADLDQMESVVQRARERFGAIHGVIHAAGVPGMGLIQLKSPDQAASVLAPKVRGTLVLEQALAGESLELMVLCSSVVAVIGGGPGQSDYCGANAFLDAYAASLRGRERTTISINWGEWLWDAWEAGLQGFDQQVQEYFKANRQRYGISFEEGQEALERIVASRHHRVVVSTREFNRMVEESHGYTAGRMLEQLQETRRQQPTHPRPVLATAYVGPRTELESKITEIWQELLGVEQVGVEDNFFELGGHSLLATQLFSRLRAEFQVEISVRNLFEMATVTRQAELIATIQWVAQDETSETSPGMTHADLIEEAI
jgi:acyl transferase domain-containing protein/acyl carrier protein